MNRIRAEEIKRQRAENPNVELVPLEVTALKRHPQFLGLNHLSDRMRDIVATISVGDVKYLSWLGATKYGVGTKRYVDVVVQVMAVTDRYNANSSYKELVVKSPRNLFRDPKWQALEDNITQHVRLWGTIGARFGATVEREMLNTGRNPIIRFNSLMIRSHINRDHTSTPNVLTSIDGKIKWKGKTPPPLIQDGDDDPSRCKPTEWQVFDFKETRSASV